MLVMYARCQVLYFFSRAVKMTNELNSIFDIICSLPAIAHSIAISTRTPTAGYGQQSKYMPDYGGVLETHDSCLKNNALGCGVPFSYGPNHLLKNEVDTTQKVSVIDSLVVSSYLRFKSDSQYSIIRAVGSLLYFDLVDELPYPISTNYAQVPFANKIQGIKYSDVLDDYLLVRTYGSLNVIKLDKSYSIHTGDDYPALNCSISIPQDTSSPIKDACLNQFNKSIVAVASNDSQTSQIRFYDLNSQPYAFRSTKWTQLENLNLDDSNKNLRGRIVRTFLDMKPSNQGIQQLDNVPSHLVNLMATSYDQTTIVDPRSDQTAQILVDKNKIPSFYPTEVLVRSSFSHKNSYQWYSLSNIHLRAFDMRYPNSPVNQINHMHDSKDVSAMRVKVIPLENSNLEVLSISSSEGICYITFDQSQDKNLINPSSIHQPFHDINSYTNVENVNNGIFGSDIQVRSAQDSFDRRFSLYQLYENGDLGIKDFTGPQRGDTSVSEECRAEIILKNSEKLQFNSSRKLETTGLEDRDVLDNEREVELEYVNIFDTSGDIYTIESKRALERFDKMKNRLESL